MIALKTFYEIFYIWVGSIIVILGFVGSLILDLHPGLFFFLGRKTLTQVTQPIRSNHGHKPGIFGIGIWLQWDCVLDY